MKVKRRKSDLVLLFELASGWELGDYIRDRASKAWTWVRISEEMNGMIRELLDKKAVRAKLFEVSGKNLDGWYKMFGVTSIVKRGPKGGKNAGKD